ncbi:hypothetical protein [Pseudanabaena sp. FACHB-2040]|uniref:hypothetical protein n=1 Tax=Pseudanabaena sp. FACHB-2040 TaxID=2692859 RepID=UPI0019C01A80|nr:hypothetical protein [Pseudanabaena sp. FACHB-2040]MBD2256138.1 hypothetical protein [Pseudanabaena sp. FACHB-2040]
MWGGVPLITLLLFNTQASPIKTRLLIAAGLLVGLLFSFRYAAAFLLIGGFLVLLQVNFPKIKAFLVSYLTFFLSSLAVIVPVFAYAKLASNTERNNFLSTHRSSLDGRNLFELIQLFFLNTFRSLSHLSDAFGPPLNKLFSPSIREIPLVNYIFGTILLLTILLLPALIIRSRNLNQDTLKKDELLTLALLEISLVTFLILLTFPLDYSPLSISRYYEPLNIALILIIYGIASARDFSKYIRALAVVFVVGFLAYNLNLSFKDLLLGRTLSRISGGYSEVAVQAWPGNQVFSRSQETLLRIREIQEEYPDALFFVQAYPYYIFDGSSNFRSIPDPAFWREAYLSQDTKLFWVLQEPDCKEVCSSVGNFNAGWPKRIDQVSRLPNLETYLTIPPDTETYRMVAPAPIKIMTADLPAGYRFGQIPSVAKP